MNKYKLDDVYQRLEEIICEFKLSGENELSSKLDHRLHKVSWTSSSELFDELYQILNIFFLKRSDTLNDDIKGKLIKLIEALGEYLKKT